MDDIILLVQEDKRFGGATDTYAQLIAEAIAAYQVNQSTRTASGLPRLQSLVIINSYEILCLDRSARSSQVFY
ncbi:hypothetical protein C8J57DRAFT_1287662 [Mycena rebaudengoi]|nr:hypothetical protein C8J57DRAFT_1287662 [Mycena rebaudengoi]